MKDKWIIHEHGGDKTQKNPISVEIEGTGIDTVKETTFSIRTLMLLSVFAIGAFIFKIDPVLLGVGKCAKDINGLFSLFVTALLVGQWWIAQNHYNINDTRVELEFDKLKIHKQVNENRIDILKAELVRWNSDLAGIEKNNVNRPNIEREIAKRNKEIKLLDIEIKRIDTLLVGYNKIYKFFNGKFVFWLAGIAVSAGLVSYLKLVTSISSLGAILLGLFIFIISIRFANHILPIIIKALIKIKGFITKKKKKLVIWSFVITGVVGFVILAFIYLPNIEILIKTSSSETQQSTILEPITEESDAK